MVWGKLMDFQLGAYLATHGVPVRPELVAAVRYFRRYRTGWIGDGVLLSVG